jgi:hypothetical protein
MTAVIRGTRAAAQAANIARVGLDCAKFAEITGADRRSTRDPARRCGDLTVIGVIESPAVVTPIMAGDLHPSIVGVIESPAVVTPVPGALCIVLHRPRLRGVDPRRRSDRGGL